MTYERAKFKIKKLTHYIEFVLAMFIVASVIIGMVDLIRYLILIFTTNPIDTYEIFQKFLGHVLLLVVGIELVAMLVFHSPSSVIEVLLYALARKLLIGNQGMIDFIIGIVAIAAIFAIRKFLFIENISDGIDSRNIFSAATPIKYINELLDIEIPEELGNTIGGVISHVAKNSYRSLMVGAEFDILNIKIRILKMKDGVIERISVKVHEG